MKSKILLVVLLGFLSTNVFSKSTEAFSAGIDGSVIFNDTYVTIDILDYQFNIENVEYEIEYFNKMEYLVIKDKKYMMLKSSLFLFLLDETNRCIFFGVKGSGKLLEYVSAAKKYSETSYLEENGLKYISKNLAYLSGNSPYAEGNEDYGSNVKITMIWDWEISRLIFINGFISFNKPYLYDMNNRVKQLRIYEENGVVEDIMLLDTPLPQIINLKQRSKIIEIEILGSYDGSKYNDTCISFINGINSEGYLIGTEF